MLFTVTVYDVNSYLKNENLIFYFSGRSIYLGTR
jgi:hypothetical protein